MTPEQAYEFYITKRTEYARNYIWIFVMGAVPIELMGDFGINPEDLEWVDGAWTLDDMDPLEWVEAMTSEEN